MKGKIENIVHNNIGHILTTQNDFKKGFHLLKDQENFEAKYKTLDRLNKISPEYTKYVYGNPLPQSIGSLGVANKNFLTKEFLAELEWLALSIRKFRIELNLFLNYKEDFEVNFLLGNYDQALDTINRCEEHLGMSIWSVNGRILVFEYTNQGAEAKEFVSEVFAKNENGLFTSSLVNFLSQRSERKLSAYKFDKDLRNALTNVKSDLSEANREYYQFQLNFFETPHFYQLKDIICFDYSNSILDRYLTFRRMVLYCVAHEVELEKIVNIWRWVSKKVKDNLFYTINLLLDNKFDEPDFFDKEYLETLDLYYAGLYVEAAEKIRETIKGNYVDFNLLNLYSRSLVYSNVPYTNPVSNKCVGNEIAENIFKVYKKVSNPSEALYNLYQINKNLDAFDLIYHLNTFIKNEGKSKSNRNYYLIANKKADPIIGDLVDQKKEVIEAIFKKIVNKTFDSLAIDYRLRLLREDYESITNISENKLQIDKAKYLFDKKSYNEALSAWRKIYEKNSNIPPIMEVAADYIFRILTVTENFNDSVKWYVENVIQNPFLVYKIDTEAIHKALKKARFKNLEINIYFPIFISLISSDDNEKSFAIELYCKSKNVKFPSELLADKLLLDDYAEWFLSKSCSNENLKTYNRLNTTKKRLDERIAISEFLLKNFPENALEYTQELNLLTNELIIYEGTQKLDESKIYANDQAILTNELAEYEGLYNRYITIVGLFLKNVKILTVNRNELRFLDKKGEAEFTENQIEYSKRADLDSFYNLFSVIREKFLYSKFGIVTYLSTRIRHGVLLGELRPEFEKYNLIFFKNKLRDKYEPSDSWVKNHVLSNKERNELISAITEFSAKIDHLIDTIIKDNIQIKLGGEHLAGWFDYTFEEDELTDLAVTLYYEEGYQNFCRKVLETLWDRTVINLEKIQETLKEQVKSEFIELINDFEFKVHKIIDKNKLPEIFTHISTCSTNIQIKLDKVASWFRRSGKTHSDFKPDMLIDIIGKGIQKAYIQKKLCLTTISNFPYLIRGEYYAHFNDFVRILIENMMQHTVGNVINCSINIELKNNHLRIIFANDSVDPEKQLDQYFEGGKVSLVKLITEGKSGLPKALKILKDDLSNEKNDLVVKNENNKFIATATINYRDIIIK